MKRARSVIAICSLGALLVLSAQSVSANPVTVQNTGTGPGLTLNVTIPGGYSGGALVGVENLLVDGKLVKTFCIDLYQFASSSSLLYNIDPLANSPTHTPAGPMGTARASLIKQLWSYGYTNALTSNVNAAVFQLAIWRILMGSWSFYADNSTYSTQADALLAQASTHNGYANLFGLNRTDGTAQSYAIERVPDGGATLMLMGLGLLGLAGGVRKFRIR